MERTIESLEGNAARRAARWRRFWRVLLGIVLALLGLGLFAAGMEAEYDRGLKESGIAQFLQMAGITLLLYGGDRVFPGLFKTLVDATARRKGTGSW